MNESVDTEARAVTNKKLPLAVLKTHPDVQRPVEPAWIAHLVDHWNDKVAGDLIVMPNPNGDGSYWVIDGPHRLAAMRDPEVNKREAWCEIHHTVQTLAEAALLQLGIGTVRGWNPVQRMLLRAKAQEPVAVAITATLGAFGTRIAATQRYGYTCVKQLEVVHSMGLEVLQSAIGTVESTWGSAVPQSRGGTVVAALGYFWYLYPQAEIDRLVNKLQAGSLRLMIRNARDNAAARGKGAPSQLTETFWARYNVGAKSHRLPPLPANLSARLYKKGTVKWSSTP